MYFSIWLKSAGSHLKQRKRTYYNSKLANSNNSKESWQTMNELLNRKSKTTKINRIIINDKAIVGDEEIANKFNEYFSEIGKN